MVNAKKHKNLKKESKEEIQERISEQMQSGFKWSTASWSIKRIASAWGEGVLLDPDYQREKVWDAPKNKALIETIFKHGGSKIPTLSFRKISEDEFEIMDGKQRILSAIVPFVENEFRLNGVYNEELQNLNLEDIKSEYPIIYGAFMSTTIQVQIAENMSYDEAVTYFIQINNSGVNMRVGEQIHAMQGTPLVKTIEELLSHKIWNKIQRVSRFNNYAYVGKMLLHVIDSTDKGDMIIVYSNKQLLNKLETYYSLNLPKTAVTSVKKTFDVLDKIFTKHHMCLNITEFYSLFVYVNRNLEKINGNKFGEFISGLYDNIHNNNDGVFNAIKVQHNQTGYDYSPRYYEWYINSLNYLYTNFLKGVKWDEIQRLSLKE